MINIESSLLSAIEMLEQFEGSTNKHSLYHVIGV